MIGRREGQLTVREHERDHMNRERRSIAFSSAEEWGKGRTLKGQRRGIMKVSAMIYPVCLLDR